MPTSQASPRHEEEPTRWPVGGLESCSRLCRPPLEDAASAEIDREQRAVVRHGHGDGIFELARAIAPAAETAEKVAVRGELLNPMVVEVGGELLPLPVGAFTPRNGAIRRVRPGAAYW